MVERLFFSKLVTKDLSAVESNRRLFEGVLTVEMKDRQGEITIRDELLKVLPIWLARGGPITDTHSNRVVGQGINFGSTTITDKSGKSYPAITIQGEIYKDYELDNEIWGAIKSGKYKGLSFGGATKSSRTPIMQKDGSMAYSLKDLEQYEVAVCEEPAVPLALITQHNEIAKAMAGNVKERDDGTMCIRCDKFKCYVEKDSLVKIEDDEDDNTQVTVLDEWKNETHPDKNGKTEGIRTTKGDDTYSDTRGPNTPNEDEDAEALENNRGEPQENGATYHGTSKGRKINYRDPDPKELDPEKIMNNAERTGKQIQSFEKAGRTHTCDSEVAEINNVEVGDKPSGMPKVQAMDKDDDEMLEEADLEEIEKKRDYGDVGTKYSGTNEAGEKIDAFGNVIPKVMGKDTRAEVEETPKGRGTSRNVTGPTESVAEARQNRGDKTRLGGMSRAQMRRRERALSGKKPYVKRVKRAMKALGLLNLLLKIKIGPVTSEARRGLIQDTKVPGSTGNQNKLQQEADYINTGTKIKPKGIDSKFSDTDLEAMKYNKEYNTDEVVREYDDSKKKLLKNDENKLHEHTGTSDSITGRHFITSDGRITNDLKTGHEETVQGLGHHNLNSYLHNTGSARVVHSDVGGKKDLSVHSHRPLSDAQTRTISRHIHHNKPDSTNFDNYSNNVGDNETHAHNSKKFPKHTHNDMFNSEDFDGNKHSDHYREIKRANGEAPYTEPGRGGFAGREPGETCDTNESTSIHNVNQPKHVNEPYDDEEAEGVKKEVGNVYHPGNAKFDPKNPKHLKELGIRWEDAKETNTSKKPATSSTGLGGNSCSNFSIHETISKKNEDPCWEGYEALGMKDQGGKKVPNCVKKNDRAMTANNAEDGVNGKMRLDNDPPAEALNEDPEVEKKVQTGDYGNCSIQVEGKNIDAEINPGASLKKDTAVMDPGSGSGGIRTGASYDNAQQDTGQKDNPRRVEEEEYSGEEDRGNLNPKYAGEEDTVTGASRGNYNKATLILNDLLLQLKKQK